MEATLNVTPSVVHTQIGKLEPGMWALTGSQSGPDTPLELVLCVEKIKQDDAIRLLFLETELPGMRVTTRGNISALALSGQVDATFDAKGMTSKPVPNLELAPSVLLGLDSRGSLLLCANIGQYDRSACGLRLETLEIVEIPSRCFWTSEFDLRVWCGENDGWYKITSLG